MGRLAQNNIKIEVFYRRSLDVVSANVITCVSTPRREDMMIALKVRKIGNSLGLVLPKEALARLKVSQGETVYLTDSENGGYKLTALNEKFPEQMQEAERIMREDRDILHELAKR